AIGYSGDLNWLALGCAAALITAVPLYYLVDRATLLGWDNVRAELIQRRTFDLLLRSVTLAAVVTALCVIIGVAAAWLVVRSDVRGRRVWQVVLTLPLAIPSYAAAYAWISWRPAIPPFAGSVLVLTLVSYPYVFLPVAAALRRLDPAQEEVARSLGHRRIRVVLGLTVRQVRPAIAAGGLLVALYVLSDFGAVATMRYEVFTFVIYGAYSAGFNPSRAAILSLALVGVALVLVLAESRVRGSSAYARIGGGVARRQVPMALGRARPVATALLGALFLVAIAFPAWRFTYWAREAIAVSVPMGDVGAALRNSLYVSLLAAVATVLLAIPVGIVAGRFRSRATIAVERTTYVAHALPGIVVAIALVFVGVRLLRPVYQEVPLLILAYVVLFLPLAVGSVRTAVEQSPIGLEEVARSLGGTRLRVLRTITVPLAAPALAGGAALVFVTAMKELPATLLLHPTGMDTLATRLWTFTSETNYAAGAPYAAALVLFAAIPTALLSRFVVDRAVRHGDVVN
ncbi:MAG: iron ABC transporter permease, partial [Acidimicrobiia bacterium]